MADDEDEDGSLFISEAPTLSWTGSLNTHKTRPVIIEATRKKRTKGKDERFRELEELVQRFEKEGSNLIQLQNGELIKLWHGNKTNKRDLNRQSNRKQGAECKTLIAVALVANTCSPSRTLDFRISLRSSSRILTVLGLVISSAALHIQKEKFSQRKRERKKIKTERSDPSLMFTGVSQIAQTAAE